VPDFETALQWLLVNEGTDYVNDPRDHGGPTRFGVTQRGLAEHLGRSVSAEEVQALTLDAAREFYQAEYWLPLRCPAIGDQAKANGVFDLSVVAGRRRGVLLAQAAAGTPVDGDLGPMTLAAINKATRPRFLCALVSGADQFFAGIVEADPPQLPFLRTWLRRADRLLSQLT
jgi:lysozyme family protein